MTPFLQFEHITKLHSLVSQFTIQHSHPPRVVLYSRGVNGLGRSLANETLLLNLLRFVGMETHFSEDKNPDSMGQQISYAMNADVVRPGTLKCPLIFLASHTF